MRILLGQQKTPVFAGVLGGKDGLLLSYFLQGFVHLEKDDEQFAKDTHAQSANQDDANPHEQ